MALDFPATPNVGDQYSSQGRVWQWTGTVWAPASTTGAAYSPIYVGDTPPSAPIPGALWWDSSAGQGELSIYYQDPNSSAWVPASNVAGSYLPIGGGTLTGPLILAADPLSTAPLGAATKQYVDQSIAGGFLSKIRNGAMDVWQRGSPLTITTGAGWAADGWVIAPTGASVTCSNQQSGAPAGAPTRCMQIAGAAGVTGCTIIQRIESMVAAPLAGQTCTFSAWINNPNASAFAPTLTVWYPTTADNFQSATNIFLNGVNLQSCPGSGAWTRVAYTFTVPSAAQSQGVEVDIKFPASALGASQSAFITACDLRATPNLPVGLTAAASIPPPELRPIGVELPMCQRYYQTLGNAVLIAGYGTAGAMVYEPLSLPSSMRAAPSVAYSSVAYGNASALAANGSTTSMLVNQCVITATGVGYAAGVVALSAEL